MPLTGNTFGLAELLDAVDDVLAWVKDREGRYLWVNRAFQLRYALEHATSNRKSVEKEILGKTDYDLSPAFLADSFRLDDEQALAGKRVVDRIERVGEFHGPAQWYVTNKIPIFDGRGRVVGTAGLTRALPQVGRESKFALVIEYLRDHFQELVTNKQLAAVSKMSLRAFERQFLASFHLTPQKYLRRLRLGIASRALIYGNDSLADVALNCGFGDQSHFTREFRRQFGRTPREYREHYKSGAAVFRTKSAGSKQ